VTKSAQSPCRIASNIGVKCSGENHAEIADAITLLMKRQAFDGMSVDGVVQQVATSNSASSRLTMLRLI
jgi:hypothetical protein